MLFETRDARSHYRGVLSSCAGKRALLASPGVFFRPFRRSPPATISIRRVGTPWCAICSRRIPSRLASYAQAGATNVSVAATFGGGIVDVVTFLPRDLRWLTPCFDKVVHQP